MRRSIVLCLLSAGLYAQGGGVFGLFSATDRAFARAADIDASGSVSAEEWAALMTTFEPRADGSLDHRVVVARAILAAMDDDGDGLFTGADVASRLAKLDTDGSGTLEAAEMAAANRRLGGGGSTSGRRRSTLLEGVIAFGADADASGTLDAAEWRTACDASGAAEEPVPIAALAGWIGVAETRIPDDPSAFGPATLIVTLKTNLDVTKDGLLAMDDLEALFAALDADADGALASDELSRQMGSRAGGTGFGGLGRGDRSTAAEPPVREVPLMPWQRTLDDALALVEATGKPLLICVNIDGEVASESMATRRYRAPEFVELAQGFIPVLASPDRHGPRDHASDGRRLPDPKFGRVLNTEHVDIEPLLYERYFRGERVAPRHIGVSPDGEILFDLRLLNDLSLIDRMLAEHGDLSSELPDPATLGEEELLASPDAAARDRLEARFRGGDEPTRVRLAGEALSATRTTQHPELLRLALRDPAPAVRRSAVEALAAHPQEAPVELVPAAAYAASGSPELARRLAAGLERLAALSEGDEKQRVRRLARVLTASQVRSEVVDVDLWTLAIQAGGAAAPGAASGGGTSVFETLARLEERLVAAPDDPRLNALFARIAIRGAETMIANGGGNAGFLLRDAEAAARRAVDADSESALSWACLASASYLLGEFETAADAASRALPGLLGWADSKLAADVLEALAQSRIRSLYPALGREEPWPAAWAADALAALQILVVHPHGTAAQVQTALDFTTNLELYGPQAELLRRAVAHRPDSANLHNYLRWQVLRDEGARALPAAYEELEADERFTPTLRWYAGLADLVAAENLVEDQELDLAIESYREGIEQFTVSMELEPDFEGSAAYYIAHAWSGLARLHMDGDDLESAVVAMRACAAAGATGLTRPDGLGNSPVATAKGLLRALREADRTTAAEELDAFLFEHGVEL